MSRRKAATKIEAKRKRGYAASHVDLTSPLSVEECVEHLRAGHFKSHSYSLVLSLDDDYRFWLELAEKNLRRHPWMFGPSWASPITYSRQQPGAWIGPVWFEGRLEPTEYGATHVQGTVMHSLTTSPRGLAVQIGLGAALFATLFLLTPVFGDSAWAWVLFVGVLLGIWLNGLWSGWSERRREAEALTGWLRERLDVERRLR